MATFIERNGLPFTSMAHMVDADAVCGCVTSGMIVIVEVDDGHAISGIVSAHTSVDQAYEAYKLVEMNDDYAIVVPGEAFPLMFYQWLTREELADAARR